MSNEEKNTTNGNREYQYAGVESTIKGLGGNDVKIPYESRSEIMTVYSREANLSSIIDELDSFSSREYSLSIKFDKNIKGSKEKCRQLYHIILKFLMEEGA